MEMMCWFWPFGTRRKSGIERSRRWEYPLPLRVCMPFRVLPLGRGRVGLLLILMSARWLGWSPWKSRGRDEEPVLGPSGRSGAAWSAPFVKEESFYC
jgi:hypothetical protein